MTAAMGSTAGLQGLARLPARPPRVAVRVNAVARPSANRRVSAAANSIQIGGATVLAAMLQVSPAAALVEGTDPYAAPGTPGGPALSSSIDVDSTIDQLVAALKSAGYVVKSGADVVQSGVETLKEGYNTYEPYLERGFNTVAPVLKQAYEATEQAVRPAITAATPLVQETVNGAVTASGINLPSVSQTIGSVGKGALLLVATATPYIARAVNFVATTPPATLGEYAIAGLGIYLVTPRLLSGLAGRVRGFAGELPATSAVDLIVNDDAVLIDLRSQKEKELSGVPDLPSSAKDRSLEVEYAQTEDRRLRGQLRDPSAIEAQVTALQIAALKRVSRSSRILLLDRNGSNSRTVARELSNKGYGKVYVIAGGFDGRNGWVQSKLQIKPAASDVSGPLFPIGTNRSSRKQLQAPRTA